jgi:hypothetical protein
MRLSWTILVGYILSIAIWYAQFEVLGLYNKHEVHNKKEITKIACPECKVEFEAPAEGGH